MNNEYVWNIQVAVNTACPTVSHSISLFSIDQFTIPDNLINKCEHTVGYGKLLALKNVYKSQR